MAWLLARPVEKQMCAFMDAGRGETRGGAIPERVAGGFVDGRGVADCGGIEDVEFGFLGHQWLEKFSFASDCLVSRWSGSAP